MSFRKETVVTREELFQAELRWKITRDDAERPYVTEYNGRVLTLAVDEVDFSSFYTLFIDNAVLCSFYKWPAGGPSTDGDT